MLRFPEAFYMIRMDARQMRTAIADIYLSDDG
jgi:hypothetical protein